MPPRIIIAHGTGGSPAGNWFPWLSAKLTELGCKVLCPQFPTPQDQNLTSWLAVMNASVGSLDAQDILIGHSIGAAFICRALEKQQNLVHAAFLIAGFARPLGIPEFDPLNESFVSSPFDWDKIRKSASKIHCYSGDDDPYVPLAFGREIAGALCTPMQVVPKGGHLNASSGYVEFPLLLAEIGRTLRKM